MQGRKATQRRKAITGQLMAKQKPHGWREGVGGMRREPAAAGAAGRSGGAALVVPGRRGGGELWLSRDSSPGPRVCNALSLFASTGPT